MALKPLNSVGGFSVGESPSNVIYPNGDFSGNKANFSGNIAALGLLTNNLYYANGTPWDLQEAAGANGYVQFNDNNNFAASANFTFDSSNNILTVTGNANVTNTLFTNNANIVANLLSGNANLGNLATANFVNVASNVTSSNLTVNLELAGNTANFSGNITALNANLGNLASANFVNVSSNVNVTNTMQAGNVRTDNLLYANGNPWDLQEAAGSNTEIQYNLGDNFAASANFTFNDTTNVLTVNGNANVTNTLLTPNINSGTGNLTLTSNGFSTVYDNTGNVTFPTGGYVTAGTFVGNVQANITILAPNTSLLFSDSGLVDGSNAFTFNKTSNSVILTGNIQVDNANLGNLAYANYINVASNLISNNVNVNAALSGNTANFSGNVVVPNLTVNLQLDGNTANFTGNITALNASLGNLATANYVNVANDLNGNIANFTGNLTSLNASLGNLATANYVNVANDLNGNIANFTGNLTSLNANLGNLALANYVNVANDLNVIGNVNAGNLVGTLANGTSNVRIFQDANIEFSSNTISNIVTISNTGLFTSGNIHTTAGYIIANGNVTANSFLVGANLAVTGEANVGSLLTSNITANGNLTITASGSNVNINLVPGGPNGVIDASLARITQVADPTQPRDAATKEYVDNISQGLYIHPAANVTSTTNLTASYLNGGTVLSVSTITGGKTITFSTNHGLSVDNDIEFTNSFNGIIAGEGYYVFSVPAANQITIKDGYFGAEVTTLTNATGLTEPALAEGGVGATLTNAGAQAALTVDGILMTVGARVLVQGQTNQAENGIYSVTTVGTGATNWVLTRATDGNSYAPKSDTQLGAGSYFFVMQGSQYAGSSYVLTSPPGEISFGTSNILFSQFSAAGSYSAGNGIAITGTTISANVDGVTTDIVSGNIVVKTGANLTTPNIGDATFSSLTWNTLSNGNVTANNLSISSIANITLDLTVGGNIQANGTISSNANVSGLNLTTSGNVQATGNVLANNVNANTLIVVPTANISNIVNAGNANITFELAGNTANFSGNVVALNTNAGNLLTANFANIASNVITSNLTVNLELAGNTANFTGNVILSGSNVTVNNHLSGNVANFSGNLTSLNANLGNLATANFFTGTLINGTSNIAIPSANGNINFTAGSNTSLVVTATGANITGDLGVTGNFNVNNLVANTLTANNSVEIGNTDIGWGTVTTSSISANQTIAQFAVAGVTGVEFLVKGIDASGSKYSMATVTSVTDGSQADYVTFATAILGGSTGSLVVNVTGGNLALQVTPASSNSTVWTAQYRTI
jgi:hypothetical protein